MTLPIVHNIPLELFDQYRGRPVILRTDDPGRLVETVPESEFANVLYVQVLRLDADLGAFGTWALGVPVDFVISDPQTQFAQLYELGKLVEKRPVRVSIPVQAGFAKAAKIAGSIGVPVKLVAGQPTSDDIVEMIAALEMFLHHPTHTQPIEFYSSTLLNFLNDADASVWAIQEDDPSLYRYIDTDNEVARSRDGLGDLSVDEFLSEMVNQQRECATCQFADHCRGYFKLPDPDYVCEGGVKEVFRRLKGASAELRMDIAKFAAAAEGASV